MNRQPSDEDIARRVQNLARKQERNPTEVLEDYMQTASWIDPARYRGIMQAIGKIGGGASKRRSKQIHRRKLREEQARRQLRLPLVK